MFLETSVYAASVQLGLVAGIYTADSSRLERKIDVALALTKEFERDAARFRLKYCETDLQGPVFRAHVVTLCEKVEFLSASTSRSRRLPLFLDVARIRTPLRTLRFLPDFSAGDESETRSFNGMIAEAGGFDPMILLTFKPRDEHTEAAAAILSTAPQNTSIIAEFQVIAITYDDLIEQVLKLKYEWELLQESSLILTLQILAIGLVAFVAPFRVGKSIVDLN